MDFLKMWARVAIWKKVLYHRETDNGGKQGL